MSISPLRRLQYIRLALFMTALLLLGLIAAWALAPASLPARSDELKVGPEQQVTTKAQKPDWDVGQWHKRLWRPLADAPPPPVVAQAPPRPPKVALFSLLNDNGEKIAALEMPDGSLAYLSAGESQSGIQLDTIGTSGVTIIHQGHQFELELP